MAEPELLDTNEVAELIGRRQRTVVKYIHDGRLKFYRRLTGGEYLIDRREAEKLREELEKKT